MTGTNQPGLWTVEFGKLGATLRALENHGLTVNHLARLRAEPEYAKRVAEFIIRGGLSGEIKYNRAKSILGDNFFGPEDWLADYGFSLSQEEFNRITDFPWSEDILNSPCQVFKGKTIKETHFAFLGMEKANNKPLTIQRWTEMHPSVPLPRWYVDWYAYTSGKRDESFADKETCRLRWYLMPLLLVPDSLEKQYQQQLEMMPANYEVATAVEEVTKNILYHRKTGAFLNGAVPERGSRTKSIFRTREVNATHIVVAWHITNIETRLHLVRYPDDNMRQTLGIALSMKP